MKEANIYMYKYIAPPNCNDRNWVSIESWDTRTLASHQSNRFTIARPVLEGIFGRYRIEIDYNHDDTP